MRMTGLLSRIKPCLVLLLTGLLFLPIMPSLATAQHNHERPQAPGPQRKLAPDLEEELDETAPHHRRDRSLSVIVQLRSATSLNDLGATEGMTGEQRHAAFAADGGGN